MGKPLLGRAQRAARSVGSLSRGVVPLLLLIVFIVGCRVDATVEIDIADDGSGQVSVEATLDSEAVQALSDNEGSGGQGLAGQLRLDDLADAGWLVGPLTVTGDGSTTVRATKAVMHRDQLQSVLDEIAGSSVFRDVTVSTDDEFAQHRQRLSFDLDVSDGWDLFNDSGSSGAIVELIDGRPIDDVVTLDLVASVAGGGDEASATETFVIRFDESPRQIAVETLVERSTAVLVRWIAYALGSLFLLSAALAITGMWLQRRADSLRPAAAPAALRNRVPGAAPGVESAGSATSAAAGGRSKEQLAQVRLVVVEPLSVLFQQAQPPGHYLLPYVRHNRGDAPADVILEAHDELLRGQIDTAQFWKATGTPGPVEELDRVFMEMRWLRKDAPNFLRELERRRIPIAAISNDAAAWSAAARDRDRLTGIWPWLVSGEAGATKPDTGMFERLRRESGIAYAHWLCLDTDLANLDAARDLGMRTALFNADDLDLPLIVGHAVVSDLADLIKRAARMVR